MATAVREEIFELNRDVSGMAETDAAVSTGEGLQEAWKYQVPVGYSLVFRQEDHFAAYLSTTAPAECNVASLVDIVIMDSSRYAVRPLLNRIRYAQARGAATFDAFFDKDYFVHLDVAPGDAVIAREGEWVVIRVNVNATLDASLSYWVLTCKRIRHTLFE